MSPFQRDKRRDAFGVIRGFSYQIERTIVAWLTLVPGTRLLLEAGEDIDYVRRETLDAGGDHRLLEQVKWRSRSISLRSPEVVESLANFLAHRTLNPETTLTFRFLTNASPAVERASGLAAGVKGLERWNELRRDHYRPEHDGELTSIRDLLLDAAIRSQSNLTGFLERCSLRELSEDLIASVEFDLGSGATEPPGEQASALLAAIGVVSTADARFAFLILFWHVFNLLGRPGEKSLLPDDWRQCLLAAPHPDTLEGVRTLLAVAQRTDSRLEAQAEALDRIEDNTRHSAIVAAVQEVFEQQGPAPSVRQEPPGRPPPIPTAYVSHPDRAGAEDILKTHHWLHVNGFSGCGKTQLAREIFEAWVAGPRLWVSFGQMSQGLSFRLNAAMWALVEPLASAESVPDEITQGVRAILSTERGTPLIVLDDVPEVLGDRRAEAALTELAGIAVSHPIRVVSTSTFDLTTPVVTTLGLHRSTLRPANFGVPEARELLTRTGAPPEVANSGLPDALVAATSGHPQLLNAAIFSLASREWSSASIDALLAGDALAAIAEESRSRVRKLVPDASTRELLDRLTLVSTPFTAGLVTTLSQIQPPILHPQDRLGELLGPWVTRVSRDTFELAPQLRNVGRTYLDSHVQRAVHMAIATDVMDRHVLSPSEAFSVCVHLVQAQQWLRLATFYLQFLMAIDEGEVAERLGWPNWFFRATARWPDEVPIHLRISIRAKQLKAFSLPTAEWQSMADDMEELIGKAGESRAELTAIVHARLVAGVMSDRATAAERSRAAIEMSRAWAKLEPLNQTLVPEPGPGLLWWAGALHVRTAADQLAVFATLEALTPEELSAIFSRPESPAMAVLLFEWWYTAADVEQDNIQDLLTAVNDLQWLAAVPDCEYVSVLIARVKSLILADRLQDVDGSLVLLAPFFESGQPVHRFVGSWTAARILSSKGRDSEALYLFARASNCEIDASWHGHVLDCTAHGATCAARLADWVRAFEWLRRAIKLSRRPSAVDWYQLSDLYAELALAHWATGSRLRAASALSASGDVLETHWAKNEARALESLWKTGHIGGWLTAIAKTGSPPTGTADGSEYFAPQPGFALRRNEAMSALPTIGGISALFYQVGALFEAALSEPNAYRAYRRSASAAAREGKAGMRGMARGALAPMEAARYYYSDAVAFAHEQAAVAGQARAAGFDVLTFELVGSPPAAMVEAATFVDVVWPTFVRLLTEGAVPEAALAELDRLEVALAAADCPERLTHLVSVCRRHFRGDDPRDMFRDARTEQDTFAALLLYLGCAGSRVVAAQERAGCLAVAMTSPMFGALDPGSRARIALYVINELDATPPNPLRINRTERRLLARAAVVLRDALTAARANVSAEILLALDAMAVGT